MRKIQILQKAIISVYCLFVLFPIFAQNPILINQNANFIDADNLGNIYLVDNTEIFKFDSTGTLNYRYSNSLLGQITAIDVSNPLRLMLFYKESNTLLFLNKQLAIINDEIYLSDFSNAEASLACSSTEGGFWIFDELTLSLIYFDINKTAIKQSVNLAGYLHGEEPIQLSEQNQKLYLQTSTKVYLFDVYGNLLKSYHLGSMYKIQAKKHELCYFKKGEIICYNVMNFSEKVFKYDAKEPCKQLILNRNKLIKLDEKGVMINVPYQLIGR